MYTFLSVVFEVYILNAVEMFGFHGWRVVTEGAIFVDGAQVQHNGSF